MKPSREGDHEDQTDINSTDLGHKLNSSEALGPGLWVSGAPTPTPAWRGGEASLWAS